jgi:hypothetical protein
VDELPRVKSIHDPAQPASRPRGWLDRQRMDVAKQLLERGRVYRLTECDQGEFVTRRKMSRKVI